MAHKTSLNDFKKPVSLTSNPITVHSAKNKYVDTNNYMINNQSDPRSQVVSSHAYQQNSSSGQTPSAASQAAASQQHQPNYAQV